MLLQSEAHVFVSMACEASLYSLVVSGILFGAFEAVSNTVATPNWIVCSRKFRVA